MPNEELFTRDVRKFLRVVKKTVEGTNPLVHIDAAELSKLELAGRKNSLYERKSTLKHRKDLLLVDLYALISSLADYSKYMPSLGQGLLRIFQDYQDLVEISPDTDQPTQLLIINRPQFIIEIGRELAKHELKVNLQIMYLVAIAIEAGVITPQQVLHILQADNLWTSQDGDEQEYVKQEMYDPDHPEGWKDTEEGFADSVDKDLAEIEESKRQGSS